MSDLFQADSSFPFDDIKLKTPRALQGGTYSATLNVNDNNIIIQTPKCKTKKGITKTAKQLYCDLLFNQDHNDFIDWLETFQEKVRELIYENSENWFHESPSLDDIEYNWNNAIRTYKQTNYLVRTFVHKTKGVKSIALQIYDSDQKELKLEDVDKEKNVICILEVIGIKFSSQSFQLDVCLRQIMVLNEKPIFNKCLIRLEKPKENEKNLGKNETISNIVKNTSEENMNNMENDENTVEIKENDKTLENKSISENDEINEVTHQVEENDKEEEQEKQEEQEEQEEQEQEISLNENESDKQEIKEKNEKENITVKDEVKKEIETQNQNQNEKDLEKIDGLEEIQINVDNADEIKLKKPNEVYLDIYRDARNKAKLAKKAAIKAYLEAKKIKELYMLDEIDSSSSESDEDFDEDDELFSES